MTKIRVVTGFVPIPKHPRPPEEYSALGIQLKALNAPLKAFYNTVEDCWLWKQVSEMPVWPTHHFADNPKKNTPAYHIVNHQKFEWLGAASLIDREADVFVWLDYGILHVPGVTIEVLNNFLSTVKKDDLAIPGCWGRDRPIDDSIPHWRFCGGLAVVPRSKLLQLDREFKDRTMRNLRLKMKMTWEVNDLARVEKYGATAIRWYEADHNETMFTNYSKG
jgi:hypothetical protein